ncbi:hypothetical protein [Haloarcula sp. 1CSR25-25]|jgi:hypothetical protein|uniref:hypothetical protein n=1 Tax=Haloarcula sp. 1CSR25-25 TaxID=2862545 RepID=UPI002895B878|nr:hypothetical protein [Haloarcula sp. 1CSR25-25]MDT3437848.1 hypothetical protein [Haloarcula sp. 1CSR25-25]
MDWERVRVSVGIYSLKLKNKLRFGVQILGLALVLLGAYNLVAVPVLGTEAYAPYRLGIAIWATTTSPAVFALGDVLAIAVGSILAFWA